MKSPSPQLSRPCLSFFSKNWGRVGAVFCQRRLYLTTKVGIIRAHLRCQCSRGGADLSNAATAANLPQKLTELWLLEFNLSLHSRYVVIMLSLVPNNDIKRKPFSCRIQPSSDIGTTDSLFSLLFVKIFASYLSSKKWRLCQHPCCQQGHKKLELDHVWILYTPLLTKENAFS